MTTADSLHDSVAPPLSVSVASAPASAAENPLAQLAFGFESAETVGHAGLPLLNDTAVCEIWRTGEAVETGREEEVDWRRDGQLLFGRIMLPIGDDERRVTYECYRQIFRCSRRIGYPYFLRIWNFLPQINQGTGDAERYKRFCAGRAAAFDEAPDLQEQFPAGTAIGTQTSEHILVYFLAARAPGRRIENPRQVNAPAYPRQYGPRSPRFCRAMAWPSEGRATLLVSGTASIVGHESQHPNDVGRQVHETWRNLEALRARAGAAPPAALRVYIRHPEDLPTVSAFVDERVGPNVPVIFLHADICRAELVLEIEGVYPIPGRQRP